MTTLASLDFDALPSESVLFPTAPWSVSGSAPSVTAAAAHHGAQGIRWATATPAGRLMYDTGSAFTAARVLSFYFRLATLPTENMFIASVMDAAGTATQGDLRMSTTGTVAMRNGGSTAGGSSAALAINTTYRVEWLIDPSANQQTLRIYVGNSTTPTSEIGPAAWSSDLGQQFSIGARTGGATATNLDYDSVVIADDWTGPWVGAPLVVDAGPDQDVEVGGSIPLDSTVSGGTTPYTYAWTVESGSGTFDDATIADPSFTPGAAGAHVLRLTVTDDDAATDFDELTVTVTGALDPVAATGWTSIGGGAATRLAAVTDDNPATYVQTGDNPAGEVLTMTLPPLIAPPGDLVGNVTASVDIGTATLTPRLYRPNGTTLVATATAIAATTSVVEHEIRFPAAAIAAAGLDPETDWASGMVVTITAQV